jgi:hypothetical protein
MRNVVGVRGFEPPTPASRTQYSTRLSYTPRQMAVLDVIPHLLTDYRELQKMQLKTTVNRESR